MPRACRAADLQRVSLHWHQVACTCCTLHFARYTLHHAGPAPVSPHPAADPGYAAQLHLELLDAKGTWAAHEVPPEVSALVFLNNQSYAGGNDLWRHDSKARRRALSRQMHLSCSLLLRCACLCLLAR